MTEDLFLTENRRDVLDGSTNWADGSVTTEKSRIRGKTKTAISELIEVAQSTEIENRSVFDPEQIGTLLYWILNDPALFPIEQRGGLIGTADEPPEGVSEEAYTKIPEDLQQYQREIHSEAAQELLRIDHPERGRQ
jgi:hypothetical protein